MDTNNQEKEIEFTLENFFFNIPLYTKLKIDEEAGYYEEEFQYLFEGNRKRPIEGYNPIAKADSTFTLLRTLSQYDPDFITDGGFAYIWIRCRRYKDTFRFYCLWVPEQSVIIKIGQHPSVADFHISKIKQYNKVLPKDKLGEFTRAIGLAANGVGIGSFVYLRRIFEYLILEAYKKALKDNAINESDFLRARMDEKIELLEELLPNFLVENKSIYSILSLGVHELDENTCLTHFDTLRVGIEIILDEKLDEFKKRKKIEDAMKKIGDLKGKIKN